MKKFLHVGCGYTTKAQTTKGFNTDEWQEIRFDIDPNVSPDILGTITDLSNVETGSIDAIFSSHNIEHIFAHEVPLALREFHRVLTPQGFLVVTCPDLQTLGEKLAQDRLLEPLYESTSGPITPLDVLYGHRGAIAQGNSFMAHKCGFTCSLLGNILIQLGFPGVYGARRLEHYDIWFLAFKSPQTSQFLQEMSKSFFP